MYYISLERSFNNPGRFVAYESVEIWLRNLKLNIEVVMFTCAPVNMSVLFTFSLQIWIYLTHKSYKMVGNKCKSSFIRHIQKKCITHED